jgi:peptidoglycan glycosyltransferase
MVSVPTYDPGGLATAGETLFSDPGAPLLNRATQGLYPPGSTFKTVTAAAALGGGVITPETIVECPGEIVIDGFPVSCRNVPQGVGTYSFRDAFTFSVNAIFAEVGDKTGWEKLLRTARAFGFERQIDFTLETAASQVHAPGSELSRVLLASTAFGQGELLATPLQMAVVAAVIANDGELARPHLASGAYRDGVLVRELEHTRTTRVIDTTLARTLRDLMVSVVVNGQASGVSIPGVSLGWNTGTPEARDGASPAWFIAFAPAEDPRVAVAVVVEGGGQGGVVASPIAGAVIRAVLAQ